MLVSAAYLGLSLKQALLATVLGGLIGNTMLGVAALIGADARVPTMVLQRAPLGQRGSYLATGLNVLQCLGWSIFELIIIATAASALADRAFGFDARLVLEARLRRASRPRSRCSGRSASCAASSASSRSGRSPLSIVYLVWWIPAHARPARAVERAAASGGSFFAGMDLVIALSVSWIPLVADYTRFSTGRRAAFWGAGLGYLFPTLFQFGFGAILVLSHPSISGPTDVLTTIAAGGVASFLALLALTVDETDEAFANIYSTAMSMQNFAPQRAAARAHRRLLGRCDGRRARVRPDAVPAASSTCSARSSCRSSACCSPTGSSAACTTRAPTSSRARRCGRG